MLPFSLDTRTYHRSPDDLPEVTKEMALAREAAYVGFSGLYNEYRATWTTDTKTKVEVGRWAWQGHGPVEAWSVADRATGKVVYPSQWRNQ